MNNPVICEGAEGAGNAGDGSVLLWVRCTERGCFSHKHELYRTRDGVNFTKISQPNLSPVPIQITDIFTVPGIGLMAMWFSGNYQIPNGKNSWGTLVSKDDGRTWGPCTVIEDDPERGYCYPAMFFTDDGAMLCAYCRGGAEDQICLNRLGIMKIGLDEIK